MVTLSDICRAIVVCGAVVAAARYLTSKRATIGVLSLIVLNVMVTWFLFHPLDYPYLHSFERSPLPPMLGELVGGAAAGAVGLASRRHVGRSATGLTFALAIPAFLIGRVAGLVASLFLPI